MRHLIAAISLYLAFVGHIGIRFGVSGNWTPNLMLLVVLLATPRSTQIAWAALAGLLFDATSGRPLGVTMLVATLVVTILWHFRRSKSHRANSTGSFVEVFLAVLAVEVFSRLLAGSVIRGVDHWSDFASSLKIAAASVVTAMLIHALATAVRSLWEMAISRPRQSVVSNLSSRGVLRR